MNHMYLHCSRYIYLLTKLIPGMDVVTDAPCRFKTPTGTITLGVDIAPAARTLTEGNLTMQYCIIL